MVNEWLIWGRRAAWCCSHTLSWIILLLSFPLLPQWPRLVFLKNRQGCLRVAMAFACGSAALRMKCRSGMPGACRPQNLSLRASAAPPRLPSLRAPSRSSRQGCIHVYLRYGPASISPPHRAFEEETACKLPFARRRSLFFPFNLFAVSLSVCFCAWPDCSHLHGRRNLHVTTQDYVTPTTPFWSQLSAPLQNTRDIQREVARTACRAVATRAHPWLPKTRRRRAS